MVLSYPLLLTFAGALGLAVAATPLVRSLARRADWLAQPSADRWHRQPVALHGGYALAGACLVVALLMVPLGPVAPLLAGACLMFLLGALDDVFKFRAATKLAVQTAIAGLIVYLAPAVMVTGQPVLDQLIALVWIVGVTNAFNLLDNMDGLSAGVAAIAAGCYLAVLAGFGATPLALVVAAFAGATLGFLLFNFQPASIFMGDSGSLFIGSFLASVALYAAPVLESHLAPVAAIPLFILLIPIFDTAFVTVTRRMAGRSPMVGGRDHLSHRLVVLGIHERTAVLALYVLAAIGGALGVSFLLVDLGLTSILVAAYAILLAGLGVVLGHVEAHAAPSGDEPHAPLVSEVAYRNRTYEVLLDVALLTLAYYSAFRYRFGGPEFEHFLTYFAASFPIVIGCQILGLAAAGKYRQMWRSFGAPELFSLLRGIGYGLAASILVVLYLYRFEGFSRLVFALDGALMTVLLVGSRLAITSVDDYLRKQRRRGRPVLIYGAGRGGTLVLRELLENRDLDAAPAGFLDDSPDKQRLRIEGLPVLGTLQDLPHVARACGAIELIVAIRDLDRQRLGVVAALCREHGLRPRVMRFALEDLGPVPHVRSTSA
jgi:UDP-GlcNAc:undecaprenyl-phosphate/decaprenyl-phosphate GlcNAc-1-phosphate transferase